MADISDVEDALVDIIARVLGIQGAYFAGSAVPSPVANAQCKIFRGWPTAADLSADLAKGICSVSVYPIGGASRRTTKYTPKWNITNETTPTLTATVSGNVLTLGGTPSATHVVGVKFGAATSGYAYRPLPSDGLPSIATALATLIPGASASGQTVTFSEGIEPSADVVVDQTAWREVRRQEQHLWVISWCPHPLVRDVVSKAVDQGIAALLDSYGNLTDQLPLPDGSSGRILYASTKTDDKAQRAGIWRRDLRYVVSYPSTQTATFTPALFVGGPLWTNNVLNTWGSVEPSNSVLSSADGTEVFIDAAGNIVGAQPS